MIMSQYRLDKGCKTETAAHSLFIYFIIDSQKTFVYAFQSQFDLEEASYQFIKSFSMNCLLIYGKLKLKPDLFNELLSVQQVADILQKAAKGESGWRSGHQSCLPPL